MPRRLTLVMNDACSAAMAVLGILLITRSDLINECIAISESLPEGLGQLARATFKLALLHAEQGRAEISQETREKARGLKARIAGKDASHDEDSEEADNRLNLWMLW